MNLKETSRTLCTILLHALALLLPVGLASSGLTQQAGADAAQSSGRPTRPAPPSLPISFGDLVDVQVFDSPELSGQFRVSQKGELALPLGGTVRVKGLTSAEAAGVIAERLKEAQIVLEPHVTLQIVEYQTQGVTVTGEVRSPGVYPLLGDRTVVDMIALAGGLNENAGKVASVYHRNDPQHVHQVKLNVSVQTPLSIAEGGLDLEPGDTISVSRSGVIYVIGDVGRSGGFLVEHNDRLSVLQALALAQGANQTASMSKTQLIRKTDSGRLQFQLDLKKILSGDGSDPLLADGDILYVPVSYKKVYSLRAIEAMIGLGSQVAVYQAH